MPDVEMIRATRADSAALLAFINSIQPHLPWSAEYLEWQFFLPPAGAAWLYTLRDKKNRIVSLYAAIAQQLRVGEQVFSARMVQDVMTDPDYRGRGFLHRLGALCAEDLEKNQVTGYTFPNDKSEKSFRRNGWAELCPVPWQNLLLSPGRSFLSRAIPAWRAIDRQRFAELGEKIWQETAAIGVERSHDFCQWRYSKPGVEYLFYALEGEQGCIALKLYSDGGNRFLHICDLLASRDERGSIDALLGHAFSLAQSQACRGITAWSCMGSPQQSIFRDFGFQHEPRANRFVFVYPAAKGMALDVGEARRWHLSQGDSDVF